jgi:hypothetical protein
MLLPVQDVKRAMRTVICLVTAALLAGGFPFRAEAKSYSSGGGHSYSSHSSSSGGSHSFSSGSSHSFSSGGSHSSSSGSSHSSSGGSTHSASPSSGSGSHGSGSGSSSPSKSFSSGSGKSYSSGSTGNENGRHSYTSAKSYSSGAGHTFTSSSGNADVAPAIPSPRKAEPGSSTTGFTFDQAAARARKEETSKAKFSQFKESQLPPPAAPSEVARSTTPSAAPNSAPGSPSYRVTPPPLPVSAGGSYRPAVYVPDAGTLSSRPVRIYNVFNPYWSRPVVIYHDPYNSLFWWWLLDRSLDDRAWWAYHHRYDMDPARYQALVAQDQQLEARVEQLETQQAPRDPNYTPPGVDRDLMYSDRYVQQTYSNRPTTMGVVAFWVLAIPTALAVSGFFIWLIWFKRWQTAPRLAA